MGKKEKLLIQNLEVYEEMLIVVDMVNGFARGDGMLVSPLVEAIIPNVVSYVEETKTNEKCLCVIIKDTHDKDAVEFKRFGNEPHCLRGTEEAELVDELIPYEENAIVFEKNSTSFMFAKNPNFKYGFVEMLDGLKSLRKVKVCGCCTDICDINGVLPMMNYFDENNRGMEVELLEDAMATYDAPWHNREEYEKAAYLLLEQQGAKKVKKLGEE